MRASKRMKQKSPSIVATACLILLSIVNAASIDNDADRIQELHHNQVIDQRFLPILAIFRITINNYRY